jgi:TolB-like protein
MVVLMANLGAAQAPPVSRVVVLPFAVNAQEDLSFLVKGVRDMLATRLAWQDRVVVMEPDLVAPAAAKVKPPYNDEKARQLGKELSAQVVVFGSITKLGKAISVDTRVVKVGDESPALTTFVQAADLDAVIPRISDVAQRINAEMFQRPDALAAQKAKEQESARATGDTGLGATESRESRETEKLPENISPLNPLFMRSLSGVASDRYWRSPRIDGTITSVAVADIDGDGKNELLVLMTDSLRVYRLAGEHFALIREFKDGPGGTYLFVDVADVMGSGLPQIFISVRQARSVSSFVLQWRDGGFRMLASGLPYYFRAQPKPVGEGTLLLGQKANIDDAFSGPVYEIGYKDKSFEPVREMNLPKEANVFNCVLADLNGSGKPMLALITLNYSLRIFTATGDETWTSSEAYAATGKYVELDPIAGRGPETIWYYLPARLVITDLAKEGRQEIVVVRNEDRAGGMLAKLRMFFQGTIYSLFWNGMAMEENWHTPNISGSLTDYTVADVGNLGRPALVMSVGQRTGGGFFEKGTSHVVAFTLKPQKSKPKSPGL